MTLNPVSARQSAGLTLEQAAAKVRVSRAYLSGLERRGGFSFLLATRLAKVYGCRLDLFLRTKGDTKKPAVG